MGADAARYARMPGTVRPASLEETFRILRPEGPNHILSVLCIAYYVNHMSGDGVWCRGRLVCEATIPLLP
jgi:hypothetical protein